MMINAKAATGLFIVAIMLLLLYEVPICASSASLPLESSLKSIAPQIERGFDYSNFLSKFLVVVLWAKIFSISGTVIALSYTVIKKYRRPIKQTQPYLPKNKEENSH